MAPVFTEETDENGDDTGRVLVKFKMKASGVGKRTGKKFTMRPDIFDARGKKIDNPPQIGGGSELKVSLRDRRLVRRIGQEVLPDLLHGRRP